MGCLTDIELQGFIQGGLGAGKLDEVDGHLDGCADCRRVVVELARSSAGVHELDVEALPRGAIVGRFVVLGVLGGGSMGVVYAAYDADLDRKVALKLIRDDGGDDEALVREARAMARLSDPNVVAVHGIERSADRNFLVMEYVAGISLRQWLEEERRSQGEILRVFAAAGRGLAAAHRVGVVHRDFKPENVLIDTDGRVRVTDFGLARQSGATALEPSELASSVELDTTVTRTGAIVGTPAYMSPEQHRAGELDGRSDQFSFCVALHEALEGERPFTGTTMAELREATEAGRSADARRAAARVRKALRRGLSPDPAQRFGDMGALLDALSPRGPRRALYAAPAAMLVAAVAGIAIARSPDASARLCSGAVESLSRVWNPQRAQEIGSTFHSSAAGGGWDRIDAMLDEYGESWVEMRVEACEATRVRGEQTETAMELRMDCLQQRLDELDSLLAVLAEGRPEVQRHALSAVYSLTPASECADARELRERGLLPDEPGLRAQVRELRSSLSRARALRNTGQYPRALEALDASAAEHEGALSHLSAAADVHQLRGELRKKTGDYEGAESELEEAVWAAEASGNGETAFAAAASLVGVTRRQDRWDDALHWSRHADAILKRIGDDDALRAEYHIVVGNYHWAKDDLESAEKQYRRAMTLYERSVGAHPDTAFAYHNLGLVLSLRGQLDDAREHHERALELRTAALGPRHPEVAESLHSLANVHNRKGEYQQAIEKYLAAIELVEEVLGPDSPVASDMHGNLGGALAKVGRIDEAAEHVAIAMQRIEERLGSDHSDLGYALTNLGDLALLREQPDEALSHFQRARTIWNGTLGGEHTLLGYPLTGLGQALIDLGRAGEAIEPLERALDLRKGAEGGGVDLARTRFHLARALELTRRDRARASRLAAEALSALEAAGAAHAEERQRVRAWLAER